MLAATLSASGFAAYSTWMARTELKMKRLDDQIPPNGLSSEIFNLQAIFVDVTNSGKEAVWFLKEERQTLVRRIMNYYPSIRDSELYETVRLAVEIYNECWKLGLGSGQLNQAESLPRVQQQSEAAFRGKTECDLALYRITELNLKPEDK